MHPLLKLLANQPHLLAEHAQAYAELVVAELPRVSSAWKRQLLLKALALLGLLVALVLAGIALMLWAALPMPSMPLPWLLMAVPLLPVTGAIGCLVAARGGVERKLLADLQQQVHADLAMWREAAGRT